MLRVLVDAPRQDYVAALYGAMPPVSVVVLPLPEQLGFEPIESAGLPHQADILHMGWPEHLFPKRLPTPDEYVRRYVRIVKDLAAGTTPIVWTMHNRLPHGMPDSIGRAVYEAWAKAADGVIHHSQWGMALMRDELPYRQDARHVVIPHGHYGAMMVDMPTRQELEERFGLTACSLRIGLVGRYGKEKQIDGIIEAFRACCRDDLQLFVTAADSDTLVPDDPRIFVRRRPDWPAWQSRREISEQLAVCDLLVSAPFGPSYLTSGAVADAIGLGLPLVVNDWPFFREMLGDACLQFGNDLGVLTRLFDRLRTDEVGRIAAATWALRENFDWNSRAARTLGFLTDIAQRTTR